jgi:mannose-6-phosphate isomerase-like protein (cupin superfamily)
MTVYKRCENYNWDSVPILQYKEDGTHFKDITRRILFDGTSGIDAQLRYFEIQPGGHSTLESHEHVHQVVILRGNGRALVGDTIFELHTYDCVEIKPHMWHQFQAESEEPFGFLCLVAVDRDKPHRPTEKELEKLRSDAKIAEFIRV